MGLIDFVKDAPCRETDSWLFDQTNLDLAMPGLNVCKGCPFWQNCEDLVQPKTSYYDGICGGKVWKNGKILARLVSSSPNRLEVGNAIEPEESDNALEI